MYILHEDYAWNPIACACKCDEVCEINKYIKNALA